MIRVGGFNGYDLDQKIDRYPNGEVRIDVPLSWRRSTGTHLVMYWRSDEDLINLMLVAKHLQVQHDPESLLTIAYMPYSRMDRVDDGARVFTLKHVCDLINSLGFRKVRVIEPHSDVCVGLLNNAFAQYATVAMLSSVKQAINFGPMDFLVFPDAGAAKRYKDLAEGVPNVATGFKSRDFATGRIDKLEIVGVPPGMAPRRALIMDDLCSYGGTFVRAAKALKGHGFAEVHLLVAHAEPVISNGELFDHVATVHATDSMAHVDGRITTYELGRIL